MNLKELYPVEESPRVQILISICLGVFIALFLNVFQPFGLAELQVPYKILKIGGFGLITIGVCFIRYFLLPRLFPVFFDARDWTIAKEILSLLSVVLSIALLNYTYLIHIAPPVPFIPNLYEMILETLIIGIFPVTGVVITNYILQLRKYTALAGNLPIHTKGQAPERIQPLVFLSENESDKLNLEASELIFIEAKGNYVEINYYKQDLPQKKVIRSTLSRMEDQIHQQIKDNALIIKCHRSFIVHLSQVESVKGNAQGYRLLIRGTNLEVPVGRKFKDCLQVWKNL